MFEKVSGRAKRVARERLVYRYSNALERGDFETVAAVLEGAADDPALPTIAGLDYDDCSGHPAWMEPAEWLGGDTSRFPLHLISNQPSTKLHSQLDHGSHSRAAKNRTT